MIISEHTIKIEADIEGFTIADRVAVYDAMDCVNFPNLIRLALVNHGVRNDIIRRLEISAN